MVSVPISPPGKNSGSTTKASVVKATRYDKLFVSVLGFELPSGPDAAS
jgi:hypothetical protein